MQKAEYTEEQLETFLREGKGLTGADRAATSHRGSLSHWPDTSAEQTPLRLACQSPADLDTTLSDAQNLYKQLSASADALERATHGKNAGKLGAS
jgi:hypothetical protein